MIKHIVMWKLAEGANAELLQARLMELAGNIPGLLDIEVGIDFLGSAQSADLVLTATLESRAALDAYQQHPAHQAVVPLMQAATVERRVVDYDC